MFTETVPKGQIHSRVRTASSLAGPGQALSASLAAVVLSSLSKTPASLHTNTWPFLHWHHALPLCIQVIGISSNGLGPRPEVIFPKKVEGEQHCGSEAGLHSGSALSPGWASLQLSSSPASWHPCACLHVPIRLMERMICDEDDENNNKRLYVFSFQETRFWARYTYQPANPLTAVEVSITIILHPPTSPWRLKKFILMKGLEQFLTHNKLHEMILKVTWRSVFKFRACIYWKNTY